MNLLDTLASYARRSPFPAAAEYWSQDNARFEQTNPALLDRVARGVNPMSGFGAAMGAMHDAVGAGSARDAALAALQSLPLFGAMRAVSTPAQGLIKASTQTLPDLAGLGRKTLVAALASAAADEAQAQERK